MIATKVIKNCEESKHHPTFIPPQSQALPTAVYTIQPTAQSLQPGYPTASKPGIQPGIKPGITPGVLQKRRETDLQRDLFARHHLLPIHDFKRQINAWESVTDTDHIHELGLR